MATTTAPRTTSRTGTGAGANRVRGGALTVLVVLLAGAGLVAAGLQVRAALSSDDRIGPGDAVHTGFGTLAVTRTHTTFVPATQGPPTMAKMTGSTGSAQLQVWVRLANSDAAAAVAYSADQFRLVSSGQRWRPDGSSLATARLPRGAVVDGQLWFDLPKTDTDDADDSQRWLEFREGNGRTTRIALPAGAAVEAEQHAAEGDGSDEH